MSTGPDDLTRYLHEHIPVSAALGAKAEESGFDAVTLSAPLEPNLNHKSTAFGGSVSALAILSGWALLHNRLSGVGITCELVIRSNQISYAHGVRDSFTATATLSNPGSWDAALRQIERRRMARFIATATVESQGTICALFEGEYVAMPHGG